MSRNIRVATIGPLNMMMERAGMSELAIFNRTREIFHYFHLPFDEESPED